MTYLFDAEIAALYGVDEAIMIYNLSYWIRKNQANKKHFYEGRYWTYNTAEAFAKLFPFWSAGQIRRILNSLEKKDVIVTGNFNPSAYDRTTWYAFSDSFLKLVDGDYEINKCISRNQQMEETKSENDIYIDNKANINTNNNTDNNRDNIPAEDCGLFPTEITSVKREKKGKKILFEESPYFDKDLFKEQFKGTDYEVADLDYYYEAIKNWSASGGNKKIDWIATARNFMLGDMQKGKFKRAQQQGCQLSDDDIYYHQLCMK